MASAASRSRGFTPSVIEGDLGRVRANSDDDSGRPVAVPVMGRIAAGTPIEAIQTRSHVINMPPDLSRRATISRWKCAATA